MPQNDVEQGVYDAFYAAGIEARIAAEQSHQYSILLRPRLFIDGDKWCALHGENIQDGVAGFGDTPHEAMQAFDAAMVAPLPKPSLDAHEAQAGHEEIVLKMTTGEDS